jgi:pimeloyl-ACP methyl ester carboxylesterase
MDLRGVTVAMWRRGGSKPTAPPVPSFTHSSLTLAYRSYGDGPLPIIAFHGFGRTGKDFHAFEESLGDIATIHAFDLPFHGESLSPADRAERPFTPYELRDFFAAFADSIGAKRFVMMGYSLGGRVALSLLETMPERITRAILIAPDGLKKKPWYRALASSSWGRSRYAVFLERPQRVQWIIRMAHRLGMINEKMERFLTGQIATREQRQLVHDVWLSFRHIEVDLFDVVEHVREKRIPVDLIFGEFDSVIKPGTGKKLAAFAPEAIRFHQVPQGHQLLNATVGALLRKELLSTRP